MPKYSELKKRYKIELKGRENDHLAGLTHYLQNQENGRGGTFKHFFKDYLASIEEEFSIVTEPQLDIFKPIEWDVPFPPPEKPKFKFVDLFAGIGGFRLAFQNLSGKCVFSSEWDHFAKQTYEQNFGEVPFGDITKIRESTIPDHDLLVAGFPCQPFSIAGVSKKNSLQMEHGFKDETQGTLFFDIVRILEKKNPKAFFLENVKNLTSHDKGKTFKVISNALMELGYNIHYQVLDGQYYVPQHRERIVIVGFKKDVFKGKEYFSFPDYPKRTTKVEDILEITPDPKYTLTDKLWNYLQAYSDKHKLKGNGFGFGLVDLKGTTRTLSARYYKDGSEILIPQKGKNPRRLTPRECARLQGYPDTFKIPVSDNQAYRQFGNSIVVPLMEDVGRQLVKTMLNERKTTGSYKVSE